MRKAVISIGLLILIAWGTSMAWAANVSGIWKKAEQTLIFYQEGENIRVQCTYRSGGDVIVWYGIGTIKGNQIEYRLHHSTDAPGTMEGLHKFTLSPDGNEMNGTWGSVSNPNMGTWTLHRVGP
jgi:hypothetical protein